jgi:MFS family permease
VLVGIWGWPAVFWFRAPIALAALLFVRGLPPPSRASAREPLDLIGAGLLALAISTLLLLVNALPRIGQGDYLAVPLLALAVASFFAFLRREARISAPVINLEFFRSRGFVMVNLASVLIYLVSFSVLLFAPYYLVRYTGLSLPLAGAVLAVSFAGSIAASPLAGRMIERLPAERVALLGAVLGGAGLFLIGNWNAAPLLSVILAGLALQGFGVGLFQVAYMDVVIATIPRQHRGVAGSVAMLTRTLGIVSGATLLTLVFHGIETSALAGGRSAADAFLDAFRTTFRLAGLCSALTGVAMALAARAR